jgi:beta-glucosidase
MYADAQRGRATILAAHRRAVEVIKAGPGRCEVGLTMAMQDIQAGPGGEEMAARMRRELQDVYLEATRGDDFIGVQTYSRQRFGPDGPLGPEAGVERTQGGDEFWPEALEATIRHTSAVTGRPVFVRGYTYWSALDSFEWISGYRLNMGLIAVDRQTQARTVKPSAGWLGRVAQAHGF